MNLSVEILNLFGIDSTNIVSATIVLTHDKVQIISTIGALDDDRRKVFKTNIEQYELIKKADA